MELRKVVGIAGARVLEGELPVPRAHERFNEEGRLVDDMLRDRLASVVERLADEAGILLAAA